MIQMQTMLRMSQQQQQANRSYLTTPIDRWSEIDRAKNELQALGVGYDDAMKGITALKTDIERLNMGISDTMSNWNSFISNPNVSQVVSGSVTPSALTESESFDGSTQGSPQSSSPQSSSTLSSSGFPMRPGFTPPRDSPRLETIRETLNMTKSEIRTAISTFGMAENDSIYRKYLTTGGRQNKKYRGYPYEEILQMMENDFREREEALQMSRRGGGRQDSTPRKTNRR